MRQGNGRGFGCDTGDEVKQRGRILRERERLKDRLRY